MVEAVVCSSAIPSAFPVQSFMGTHFADGGCITNLDIFSAVEKCLAAGFAEEDIIIDAVMASDRTIKLEPGSNWKTYDVYWRIHQIRGYDEYMYLIYQAMQAYPNVHYRYIVKPTMKMPGSTIPLDFDHDDVVTCLNDGYGDAKNVLEKSGAQGNAYEVMEEWHATKYKGIKK
jgi:hypothetical protein